MVAIIGQTHGSLNVTSLYGKTSAIDSVDGSSTGIAMCQIAFLFRSAEVRLWLQAAVRATSLVRPLYPQVRTLRMAVPLVRT